MSSITLIKAFGGPKFPKDTISLIWLAKPIFKAGISRFCHIVATPVSILLKIPHKSICCAFLTHSASISVLFFFWKRLTFFLLSSIHSDLDVFCKSCSEEVVFYSIFTVHLTDPVLSPFSLPFFYWSFYYISEFQHVFPPSFLVGIF